jgi:hypothetical protein
MITPVYIVPRVEIPDLTPEERDAVEALRVQFDAGEAHAAFIREQQKGIARAMVALGKPIFRGKPKRRKKPTKNVRHVQRVKTRVASLWLAVEQEGAAS